MSARCVGVIGGGAWGTALALAASRAGHSARIWARDAGVVRSINQDHRNPTYLGEVDLGEAVSATEDLADMASCDPLLLVVPAQFLRGIATQLATLIPRTTPVIVCAKGIETKTGLLMTEVAAECLAGWPLAVLSGPSFANEVAAGQPTAVTLAADDLTLAQQLVDMIGSRTFRPYASDDLLRAEVVGAVKNVLAIACGIAVGQGLWRQHAGRPDLARSGRDDAVWCRDRRPAGDFDGPVWGWGFDAHRLQHDLAQYVVGSALGERGAAGRYPGLAPVGGGRGLYRVCRRGAGALAGGGDADLGRG